MVFLSLAVRCVLAKPKVEESHFYFCGPISKFMGEGLPFSKVKSGLPFTFDITPNGRVEGLGADLKGRKWKSIATIDTLNLSYRNGTLATEVKLINNTGSALEGVRFDYVETVEIVKTKDASGKEVLKERPLDVQASEPQYLGDIEKGDDSDTVRFRATGLEMKPETQRIQVRCVVSGLYYNGSFTLPTGNLTAVGLDCDAQGHVIVGDRNAKALTRFDADGKNPQPLGSLPDAVWKFAVNPANGEIIASYQNGHQLKRMSATGDDLGPFPAAPLPTWPGNVRYDKTGALYLWHTTLSKYVNGAEVGQIEAQPRGHKLGWTDGFDIDPNGAVWAMATGTLLKIEPDLKTMREVTDGTDWRLGRLTPHEDNQVRCDKLGNVYVSEYKTKTEAYRISVFDNEGKFIRMFGRGGREQPASGFLRGQLPDFVTDMAIGPDGTVYVATKDQKKGVMMFVPF